MNAQLDMLIGYMIIGVGTIVITIFLFNFLTRGFFLKYLSAKASRGKKVLIRIYNGGETYFQTGKISSNVLEVKYRDGSEGSIEVAKKSYRCLGIMCVDLDEEGNVFVPNSNQLCAFDPVKYNHLLDRAINAPSVVDEKITRQMILGAIIVIGIAIGFGLFVVYSKSDVIIAAIKTLQSTGVVQ